ncbi:MAG: dTDP-4-dehydrorhamnose reductase [Ignavibacteriae bacterium]|nr:dTDP-4-dehydrorhamnose reductase [Ignavibacteriota bacterium]MCB9210538.1 dTDP-4-dehydrorhamnose reductase [Ignavibacteriales bacterium]MCB9257744.1 dTDP-4-dehydrorhamnose reductase [Ignavibacteriales bacterium]
MIKNRILIIGSNGMLGQQVTSLFLNNDNYEIRLASFEDDSFFEELPYTKIDISNKIEVKKLFLDFFPDFVINLAAYTNVDKSETEKETCWNINVNAIEYLAKYCVPANSHLIHISSDYVFDGLNGPYAENDLPNPISYYGRSKLAGENIIKKFNIPSTIIRTNVLFGSARFGRPDFVKWVVNSLENKNNIRIVTDQINNPTFLDDIASAIKKICDTSKTGLYNIGGAELLNRYEFTERIAEYFNLDMNFVTPILTSELNQPAPRPLKSGLINLKAETELSYKPRLLNECFRLMEKDWLKNK